jgi:small-conductance mechanosensitive channel
MLSVFRRGSGLLFLLLLASATGIPQNPPSDESQNILSFLNQTIVWYRQLSAQQQVASQPSEVLLFNQNRQFADEIAQFSFDFARARAQMLPNAAPAEAQPGENNQNPGSVRLQNLVNAAAKADAALKAQQQKVQALKQQANASAGRQKVRLDSLEADEESELALDQARADTLHSLVNFSAGTKAKGAKTGSLQAQIEELARSLPGVVGQGAPASGTQPSSAAAATAATSAQAADKSNGSGLFALLSRVVSVRRKVNTLDDGLALTDQLANLSQTLRAPLVKDLQELTQRGNALISAPDSTDPKAAAQHRNDVNALTAEYKSLAGTVLPLGKQAMLLDVYRRNLSSWRESAGSEYSSAVKSLALDLGALALILGIVLAISELWRRATFRYIHDKRRRFQFLLLRRIVVWSLVAIIIVLAFASEIGSLATFAGLLTAGLAVALQNVILSIVGYFFLIGKHGLRVGDRVQVAGVSGNIIDIGLLRLHLMEVGGYGAASRPTGRVVVFPNAVVFQANSGLFKQAPGAKFVWHEIRLTLAPEGNYEEAEKRMLEAVNSVYADYRENIEKQHHHMVQALAPLTLSAPEPESRLDLTEGGLTISIRYPVDLDNASEIDDRITRAVLEATARNPRLRILGSGKPEVETVEQA